MVSVTIVLVVEDTSGEGIGSHFRKHATFLPRPGGELA
jgi:hypothetical protein